MHLGIIESIDALVSLVGMIIKILWAFLWQEEFDVGLRPILTSPFVLSYAVQLTPYVNMIGEKLDGIKNTDAFMVSTENVYPGWDKCNLESPHALWHKQSADGFLDLVLVVDKIMGMLD